MPMDSIRREFADPGNEFRFAPFWFINHELNEAETRWQVQEMNRQGVGGFIFHPRHGLITPYMSAEFLQQCGAAIDEARKLGMKAYLYDENNWPSGPADAMAFIGHPEYRMSGAFLSDEFDLDRRSPAERELKVGDELVAVVAVPLEEDEPAGFPESAINLTEHVAAGVLQWRPRSGRWRVYVISRRWHVGTFFGSYLDTLNPDAVKRFMELTHEVYAACFEQEFGATVDGIFTDEPSMNFNAPDTVPWTPRLPAEFEWRKHYDLLTAMPALYRDMGPGSARLRCDFYDTVIDLYTHSFFKQIHDYCNSVRLSLIGHVNCEGEMVNHARQQGDFFRGAQWMHWGGCDYLREMTWTVGDEQYNVMAACKFASSAGHLLGKRIVGSECFGLGSQWAIDLRNLKWMSDWAIALGVNQLEPHAFYYSIQGFRKWECPPGEFYQSPFWPYYRTLSDYVGRLSAVFRDGKHIADVAHFYPVKSMWAEMDPESNDKVEELRRSFGRLGRLLLKINCDFDYVSEEMLQRADFSDGTIGVKLPDSDEVAERFKILAMPACTTVSRKTAEALRRFVDGGGRIIAIGELPGKSVEQGEDRYVAGIFEAIFGDDYELSKTVATSRKAVVGGDLAPGWRGGALVSYPNEADDDDVLQAFAGAVFAAIEPDVRVRNGDGEVIPDIVHLHYEREGQHFLLLQNTSRETDYDFTVSMNMTGEVTCWDAETGENAPLTVARAEAGGMDIPLELPPAGAALLCIDPDAACPSTPVVAAEVPIISFHDRRVVGLADKPGTYSIAVGSREGSPRRVQSSVRAMPQTIVLDDEWEFQTEKPNALPLSNWQYTMSYRVTGVDSDANEHIYRAAFDADSVPREARLLLDGLAVDKAWERSTVVSFQVLVNGQPIGRASGARGSAGVAGFEPGEYLDHYIYEAPLDGLLVAGKNQIEVRTAGQLYETPNLGHPVIIVGRFAVTGRGRTPRIGPEPGRLKTGAWDRQGYPFYSGIGVYRQSVRLSSALRNCRLFLEMAQPGDMFEAIVNGKPCGVRAWEPWSVEITDAIAGPTNEIEIRVANSLQNLLVHEPKPSGILRPVRIVPRKEVSFELR
jgi:hypothetical protein